MVLPIFRFLALILCSDAARTRARIKGVEGDISHVYTFGAPHPSNPMLTAKNGGCFDGYRIVNAGKWRQEDTVPLLLVTSTYNHPKVKTIVLTDKEVKYNWECGKNPPRGVVPRVKLHKNALYQSNVAKLGDSFSRTKEAADVGLKNSYNGNLNEVQANVQASHWELVGTATAGEDISHLMQEPNSKRCILTFEGTDSFEDFKTDANILSTSFCGLPGMEVHTGFKRELMNMVESEQFQSGIREKLGKCSSVDAVGHSLGGAVAALFAACVSHQIVSPDYEMMSWVQQTAEQMDSL